ncbi:MAG: hypothetical protein ACLFVU_02770 [Phycisphaerae bacterium]
MTSKHFVCSLTAMAVLVGLTGMAAAGDDSTNWLSAVEKEAQASEGRLNMAEHVDKPFPVRLGVEYVLATDYIFRGVNFSEYDGEGREDLNHQLSVGAEMDTEDLAGQDLGKIGGYIWFEWYAGQEHLTPEDSSNLQEVDYVLYWRKEFPEMFTEVELGWIAYQFPRESGNARTTYEVYGKLSFDDSPLWEMCGIDVEGPVLNPFVAYYHDYDVVKGGWLEIGIHHDIDMKNIEQTKDVPVLRDMIFTPSIVYGVSHRYWDKAMGNESIATSSANINYGLGVAYDLSSALDIPEQYGKFTVGGFLNYSQALDDSLLNDEFYGGMKLGWQW